MAHRYVWWIVDGRRCSTHPETRPQQHQHHHQQQRRRRRRQTYLRRHPACHSPSCHWTPAYPVAVSAVTGRPPALPQSVAVTADCSWRCRPGETPRPLHPSTSIVECLQFVHWHCIASDRYGDEVPQGPGHDSGRHDSLTFPAVNLGTFDGTWREGWCESESLVFYPSDFHRFHFLFVLYLVIIVRFNIINWRQ